MDGSAPFLCPTCQRGFEAAGRCPDDDTTLVAVVSQPSDRLIGLEVGGFTVRQRLGAGGMGAVYLAFQHSVGRNVALKVMAPSLEGDPALVKRFMREAKLTAQLSSPNIVTTLDFGQTPEGQLFLAMELVDGETLSALVRREGPLPWRRAVHLAMQICDGLSSAHARGIIHRDLKPQNVMVQPGPPELVKLLDFGLARGMGDSRLTASNMVMGSPNFVAPEIILGEDGDARSDLYALGGVLHFMLEGRPPFGHGSMTNVMARQLQGPPMASSASVPPPIASIVSRLLDVDPQRRPRTAGMARELLAAALEVPEGASASKPPRRRVSGRSVAFVVIGLVGVVGAGFSVWRSQRPASVLPPHPVDALLSTADAGADDTDGPLDGGAEEAAGAEPLDGGADDAGVDAGTPVPRSADAGVLKPKRSLDGGRKDVAPNPLWDPRHP